MSKGLVSVVLIKRIIKVQGRDKGSSVTFDYDNKIIQQMTAIYTQYTVSKNIERWPTFYSNSNDINVQCDVSDWWRSTSLT